MTWRPRRMSSDVILLSLTASRYHNVCSILTRFIYFIITPNGSFFFMQQLFVLIIIITLYNIIFDNILWLQHRDTCVYDMMCDYVMASKFKTRMIAWWFDCGPSCSRALFSKHNVRIHNIIHCTRWAENAADINENITFDD